jgi:hypothetical protein
MAKSFKFALVYDLVVTCTKAMSAAVDILLMKQEFMVLAVVKVKEDLTYVSHFILSLQQKLLLGASKHF